MPGYGHGGSSPPSDTRTPPIGGVFYVLGLTRRLAAQRRSRCDSGWGRSSPSSSLVIYIFNGYTRGVDKRSVLRQLMQESSISQSGLSRVSGVRQPNISGCLSGRKPLGDEVFGHLLNCLGYEYRVRIEVYEPELMRSERRSWVLHRHLSGQFDDETWDSLRSRLLTNVDRMRGRSQGEPHESNIREWNELIDGSDWLGLRKVLTGLDRHSIEMREVSPMFGLLDDTERRDVLRSAM